MANLFKRNTSKMDDDQKPPQRVEATDTSNPAAFIFLHGYDDDSNGWINIAHQFQAASKLPHLTWIFPNAPFNNESRATAWYTPSSFSPIPIPSSSSAEIDDEEESEYASEMLASVSYIDSLIDTELQKGLEPKRIMVGGFSQGCAISLLVGLVGKHAGKLGGIVGLSGYLPSGIVKKKLEEKVNVFLAHGTRDMLVPMRIYRETKKRLEKVVGEGMVEGHEYEGLGHAGSGVEFRHMCAFLEKKLPG